MYKQKEFISILAIMIYILVFLTGCYDKREIDELAYPIAIGLDAGKTNALRLTLQVAVPLVIGGDGGGSSGGNGGGGGGYSTSIITVETPSIYAGLNLINNIISKEINLSHAKLLVISKTLALQGIENYLHAMERGREIRPHIYIAVCEGSTEEYLKSVKPVLEINPAKFYELLLGKSYTGFYPNVMLHDFYFQEESDSQQPVAIMAGISKYMSADQFTTEKTTTVRKGREFPLEGDYEAGDLPILADQKNEVMGMAVFKGDKMVGTADGAEATYYLLVTGKYNYAYWTIPDPQSKGEFVIMNIKQRRAPDIMVDISGEKPVVNIALKLEGDFTSIQSGADYETNTEIIETTTEELIVKEVTNFLYRTTNEFSSDICGFGKMVKGKFLTWSEWTNFNWFDKYSKSTFNVSVDYKVRRTGLMVKSVK